MPNDVIKEFGGYDENIRFVRCNPNSTEHDWAGKWNQTVALKIPTNGDTKFTITSGSGDNYNGEWSAAPDDNSVTVTVPTTVANGTVTIGRDNLTQNDSQLTVQKGTSFYVKATPDTGYTFKNWTVNSAPVSTENTVMVSVSDTGTLSVKGTTISSLDELVPNFEGGTTGGTTTLYLVPHSDLIKGDKENGVRYEVFIFEPGAEDTHCMWYTMTKLNDSLYTVDVPNDVIKEFGGYNENIRFVRCAPDSVEHNWDGKWNRTVDLKIPTDGRTKFTIKSGSSDDYDGEWSTHQS